MKLWNKNICLTNRLCVLITIGALFSTLILASVWSDDMVEDVECNKEMWVPTADDIAYQDSMYSIIQNTQSDIDTIKESIVYILERLDYEDGTYDNIRYVKGSEIDKRRN